MGTVNNCLSAYLKQEIDALRLLFFHEDERTNAVYALQRKDGTYSRGEGPVTDTLLYQHLQGKVTSGAYQLDNNNRVKWCALDIDIDSYYRDKYIASPTWQKFSKEFKHFAQEIYNTASRYGPAYIAFSGRKGLHIYQFYASLIKATRARALAEKILAGIKTPDSVHIDIFPRQTDKDGGLGSLIKCPFGRHQVTGKRCRFIDQDFHELNLKPSDLQRTAASTIPEEAVDLSPGFDEVNFQIKDSLPSLFKKLLRNDFRVRELYLGKDKEKGDKSRSGFDWSLLGSLIIRGIDDPSDLATILWSRPNSKSRDPGGMRYLGRTISKAISEFKHPEKKRAEERSNKLKERFHENLEGGGEKDG